jgi:hypothetical protein
MIPRSPILFDFWLFFCHCIVCMSFSLTSGYLFAIVLSVCPFLWLLVIFLPLYCLSVLLCDFWQWQTDNQKSKRTDRQYNGEKITRSHREGPTDNTMGNFSVTSGYLFGIVLSVCPFLWLLVIFLPLYCLSVLCDFWLSFCHCIVCLQTDNQKSKRTDR